MDKNRPCGQIPTATHSPCARVSRGNPPDSDLTRIVLQESALTTFSIHSAKPASTTPSDRSDMIPSDILPSSVDSSRSADNADVLRLMAKHQGLVRTMVDRVLKQWAPCDDPETTQEWRREMVQEGQKGLRRAAEKFDPGMGKAFSTYAMHWIFKYVHDAVVELHEAYVHPSLDMPMPTGAEEGCAGTLGDTLPDKAAEDPSEQVARAVDSAWARELAATTLPPREYSVVARYLGLDGRGGRPFQAIAEEDGVSTQCIHRIYQRAIDRLKKAARPELDPAA